MNLVDAMAVFYRPRIFYTIPIRPDEIQRQGLHYLELAIAEFEARMAAEGRLGAFDRNEAYDVLLPQWKAFVDDWKAHDALGAELITGVGVTEEENNFESER